MRTWWQHRLTFVLVLIVWAFGTPARAQTEAENASLAVSGLQAFGRFLNQLTGPEGDLDAQLDAVGTFVKPLLSDFQSSEEGKEAVKEHVEKALSSFRQRQKVVKELEQLAKAIILEEDEEEKQKLKKEMDEMFSKHFEALIDTVLHVYQALGVPKKEAEAAVSSGSPLSPFFSLLEVASIGKYYNFAALLD
ncbi:hypothetical protein ACSSS7_002623 [Eimeria intestinalis]